jgi:hypothetical protein
VDRLGRDAAYADALLAQCEANGVSVRALDGGTHVRRDDLAAVLAAPQAPDPAVAAMAEQRKLFQAMLRAVVGERGDPIAPQPRNS